MDDLLPFQWRLAEILAWVALREPITDPANSLRTPALQPPGIDQGGYGRYLDHDPAIVDRLATRRTELLRAANRYPASPVSSLESGRLLLYFQEREDADGAAQGVSKGFFDGGDAPPWDTWLRYVPQEARPDEQQHGQGDWDTYLISWVPDLFVDLVNAAIPVTMMGSLLWADDPAINSSFLHRLRGAGLMR